MLIFLFDVWNVHFNRSTVVLYDIQTQKQDFIINTARKAITSLSLSADGRYLATGEVIYRECFCFFLLNLTWFQGGHDPKVRVWDLTGDKSSCIELGDHKFAIDCVVSLIKLEKTNWYFPVN